MVVVPSPWLGGWVQVNFQCQVLPVWVVIWFWHLPSVFIQRSWSSISLVMHMRMAMPPPWAGAICSPWAFIVASICLRTSGGMFLSCSAILAMWADGSGKSLPLSCWDSFTISHKPGLMGGASAA